MRLGVLAPALLATDVGSEGHNLQFCHVLVNFDLPWNPMVIEQRIGRLHRFGQTEEVRVYDLCARGTAWDQAGARVALGFTDGTLVVADLEKEWVRNVEPGVLVDEV